MNDQEAILAEARSWLGTPYHHQASRKAVGADCLGLVRGVWRAQFGNEPEAIPNYTPDWDEIGCEELLLEAARRWLIPRERTLPAPGNVILFRMRSNGPAKHLGICSVKGAMPTFIHAYTGLGVVETPLSTPWLRKVAACFEFPKLGGK